MDTPITDNRRVARRRILKSGRIVFNRGRSTIDCIVRDISPRGARLEVASVVGVPDAFFLAMPNATQQPCRVTWRRLKQLGVAFEG